jgi:hypothetical protein
VIRDTATAAGDTDVVEFDASWTSDKIAFFMEGSTLHIGMVGSNDTIRIESQGINNQGIETFQLSDGKFLTSADINQVIQNMTAYAANNSVAVNNLNDVKGNAELMNIVSTAWHS